MNPSTARPREVAPAGPGPGPGPAPARAWHAVGHAENFPVASILVPRRLRGAVVAIYRFARHADDIADEGDADVATRDLTLHALDDALRVAQAGRASGTPVVDALRAPMQAHSLGWVHLHHLLDAFRQDLRVTRYPDPASVQAYCDRSANPVGRLMLELFGAATPDNVARADAICSALQRINFLQDVTIDRDKGRVYLPLATLARAGVDPASLDAALAGPGLAPPVREAIRIEAARARAQMLAGADLVGRVPVRLGLELRFIIAGGLRILERIARQDHDVSRARPVLGWRDAPALLRLALRPRAGAARTVGAVGDAAEVADPKAEASIAWRARR
ncbi:MAG: squalene synthase HpnC [Lautropia sp.]